MGRLVLKSRHRLLAGDCRDPAAWERLLGGERVDLLMIDPPYGIDASAMTMSSAQSSLPKEQRLSNVKQWDGERPDVSAFVRDSSLACVWGGQYFASQLPVSDDWLCWHKKNDNLSFSEFELAWTNFGKRCRHLAHHWGAERKEHITQKPIAVIAWAIQQAPDDSGNVVDCYCGSGTTIMACEALGRKCLACEIEPAYVDVCCRRWLAKYPDADPVRHDGTKWSELTEG